MPSAYAYHRQVENTYLVRDRDRQRRRELLRVLLGTLPLAVALLGYTWLHVRVLDTAYAIGELERELASSERHRAELALRVAQRAALPEVEARAREELGMVAADLERTLFWVEVAPAEEAGPAAAPSSGVVVPPAGVAEPTPAPAPGARP